MEDIINAVQESSEEDDGDVDLDPNPSGPVVYPHMAEAEAVAVAEAEAETVAVAPIAQDEPLPSVVTPPAPTDTSPAPTDTSPAPTDTSPAPLEDSHGVDPAPVQGAQETVPEVPVGDQESPGHSGGGDEGSDTEVEDNDDEEQSTSRLGVFQGVTYNFIGTPTDMVLMSIPKKKGKKPVVAGECDGEDVIIDDEYLKVHEMMIEDEDQEEIIWK
jgi:hypothetical protein